MPSVDTYTLRRLLGMGTQPEVGLESRCVQSIDYDQVEGDLTIEFVERGTYKYHNFPLDEYVLFAGASSQGRYFNLYIRDKYSYTKVN